MAIGRPKKMMNMYILDILKRNTDIDHAITQKEIQQRLETEYDMVVDRKAVKANLEDFINDGTYDIYCETKTRLMPNAKTGELEKSEVCTGFYYESKFTDSELRLLIDSVLFSKSIPTHNKSAIIENLKSLSNKYFKFNVGHIKYFESADREINKNLFLTIEMLNEAIDKGLQVKFHYNEYGADKKLHNRLDDNGEPREYIINPYQIVAANGRYYLICNYEKYDDLANYRLDRITDIELLETPRKPKNKVQGLVGLNIAQYMNEHIYMFTGKSVRAKFEAPKYLISDILDYFKADVIFKELDEKNVIATVKANETDLRLWARQYAGQIKITEPTELAQACKQDLLDAIKLYED